MDIPTIYSFILSAALALVGYFSKHWATTTEKAVEKCDARINNLKDVLVETRNHVKYLEHQHQAKHGEAPFDEWEQKIL